MTKYLIKNSIFRVSLLLLIILVYIVWLQPKKAMNTSETIKEPFVSYAYLYQRPRKKPTIMLMDSNKNVLSFFLLSQGETK